jgi:hypothetical protein
MTTPEDITQRCTYEQITEKFPDIPFISNKGTELVLTPQGANLLERAFQMEKLNEQTLFDICALCHLCRWQIHDLQTTWRITREGYKPVSYGPPWMIENFEPEIFDPKKPLIVVVDDQRPEDLGEYLANRGYRTFSVKVNPSIPPLYAESLQPKLCKTIVSLKPGIIICDKGLGYFEGLKMIDYFRSKGIKVILFTAEYDSSPEVVGRSDYFLPKPLNPELLQEALSLLS